MEKRDIVFTYIKGNTFAAHHIDGVHGGLTPQGKINLNFFSERFPIPQTITHAIDNKGKLKEEISRTGKEGVVREVETGVIMDKQLAVSLRDWLNARIKEVEKLEKGE